MEHPDYEQVREALDVGEALLKIGKYFQHAFGFVRRAAAFWYLRGFSVRAAYESDGSHFKHRPSPSGDDLPSALILVQLSLCVLIDRVFAFGRHDILGRSAQFSREVTLPRIANHRHDAVHLWMFLRKLDCGNDIRA